MTRLPRPVKSALEGRTWDAEVTRGWARLQIKRRVGRRAPVGQVLAAAAAVLIAAVVWDVTRPSAARVDDVLVSAPPARAVSCVEHAPIAASSAIPVAMTLPVAPVCAPKKTDVVGELLLGVGEALKKKDVPRMEALLGEITQHHENDPRTAQALFVLGRIQLEYRHDAVSAAKSFHHALELDPPADLVAPLWQAYELASAR
jgi:hypothetical protein